MALTPCPPSNSPLHSPVTSDCPRQEVPAGTLASVLAAAFAAAGLRGYVLDEQGAVRKHVGCS
jgi:hypothetical protein